MIIYNERLLKFQGYKDGTFYVLRPADVGIFKSTQYEDVEKVFEFRKNTKEFFLYENRVNKETYYIIRKNDLLALKKESVKNQYDFTQIKNRFKELNFYRYIDFVRVNTIYMIGNGCQERFLQSDSINLPENTQIENSYIEEYFKHTPIFRVFHERKIYYLKGSYYIYCMVGNEKVKHELLFDESTFIELFRKYQHPDLELFDLNEAKANNELKIMEESEPEFNPIPADMSNIFDMVSNAGTVSKSSDEFKNPLEGYVI